LIEINSGSIAKTNNAV